MFQIANDDLKVDLLDPSAPLDHARQGGRFCWGGYVWQVRDAAGAPLLAGPEWPAPTPSPYNGQGIPESLRHAAIGADGRSDRVASQGFVLGVGVVNGTSARDGIVAQPCPWAVTRGNGFLEFCTTQSANGIAVALTRTITLAGRKLTSATLLANTGERPLRLIWFAHPFFALTNGAITCDLPAGWSVPSNAAYEIDAHGRLSLKTPIAPGHNGPFVQLSLVADSSLRATVSHPRLAWVKIETNFFPSSCPIWGNSNTWSIEPYIRAELAPGTQRSWAVTYEFGPPAHLRRIA